MWCGVVVWCGKYGSVLYVWCEWYTWCGVIVCCGMYGSVYGSTFGVGGIHGVECMLVCGMCGGMWYIWCGVVVWCGMCGSVLYVWCRWYKW